MGTSRLVDYITEFRDDQINELLESANEMFREVYVSVADLPKHEWPAVRIKHLIELRKSIGQYETEIARRKSSSINPGVMTQKARAARVFISYAHADEAHRITLEKHLALLGRIGLIETWSDAELVAGQTWDAEIRSRLDRADIVLFLVSANFLASDYSYMQEVLPALAANLPDVKAVVPIMISPVDWRLAPFSKFQALPKNAKPITTWANQDEAWASVASGLRALAQSLAGC